MTKESPEVIDLREKHADELEFYRWLEWTATQQLHLAQEAARTVGMKIGIMSDMAVGVHPLGSEVWWNPERFAKGATVGAPPDMFNQQGQNWSQPRSARSRSRTPATCRIARWCAACSTAPAPCASITS